MINYSDFAVTNDTAYNIYKAILYCKDKGENGIVFNKNTYKVSSKKASEGVFCFSNHSDPGFKRCLFLLEDFKDFTIDGGGSEFVLDSGMTAVILSRCSNITLKNISFSCPEPFYQFKVLSADKQNAVIACEFGTTFIHGLDLYGGEYYGNNSKIQFMVIYDSNGNIASTKAPAYYISSHDDAERTMFFENSDGTVTAKNLPVSLKEGQKLVFTDGRRDRASIFVLECVNTVIESVNLYSGIGMGIIAQNCDTVTVNKMNVYSKDGRCPSICADATHFVHCKGNIQVTNCDFSSQLDDALNIHSIYFKIIDKTFDTLILEQVNNEQKGVDIIKKGSVIEVCNPDTLLPYDDFKVLSAKRINLEITEVKIDGNTKDITIGDVADEVSYVPDVLFENCRVTNVRGRGMLLASAGKILVKNNYFSTTSSAIKFESDGKFWYESGRTKDVVICNNTFYKCKYCQSGTSVITVAPREKVENGRYYHKKIEIINNNFDSCFGNPADADNVETFIFKNNIISNHNGDKNCVFKNCKNVITDN